MFVNCPTVLGIVPVINPCVIETDFKLVANPISDGMVPVISLCPIHNRSVLSKGKRNYGYGERLGHKRDDDDNDMLEEFFLSLQPALPYTQFKICRNIRH